MCPCVATGYPNYTCIIPFIVDFVFPFLNGEQMIDKGFGEIFFLNVFFLNFCHGSYVGMAIVGVGIQTDRKFRSRSSLFRSVQLLKSEDRTIVQIYQDWQIQSVLVITEIIRRQTKKITLLIKITRKSSKIKKNIN